MSAMNSSLILLVDADRDTRQILRQALEHSGYGVLDAATAEEGLALARAHAPDMVMGDFPLVLAGDVRFSAALREDDRFADTPILSITARAIGPDLVVARELADEVLLKPVRPRVVVETVARLLNRGPRAVHEG